MGLILHCPTHVHPAGDTFICGDVENNRIMGKKLYALNEEEFSCFSRISI